MLFQSLAHQYIGAVFVKQYEKSIRLLDGILTYNFFSFNVSIHQSIIAFKYSLVLVVK